MEKNNLISGFEKILNIRLAKKFSWFYSIRIKDVNPPQKIGPSNYLSISADIYVDEEWAHSQWREYHYSTNFPENLEDLSFGDIIGGSLSKEIQQIIKSSYLLLTEEKIDVISFDWFDTHLI